LSRRARFAPLPGGEPFGFTTVQIAPAGGDGGLRLAQQRSTTLPHAAMARAVRTEGPRRGSVTHDSPRMGLVLSLTHPSRASRCVQAVTVDLYDAHSPCGAVHTRHKNETGRRARRFSPHPILTPLPPRPTFTSPHLRRAALASLAVAYGRAGVAWEGPRPAAISASAEAVLDLVVEPSLSEHLP